MVIGAGLKGTAIGTVRQLLGTTQITGGLAGISDDMLGAVLGYIVMKKAKGTVSDIGTGILIASAGGFVEGLVGGMPILGSQSATPSTSTPAAPGDIVSYASGL